MTTAHLPIDPPADSASLGEMRAQWRESHICLRCGHHVVCGMAAGLDQNMLPAISQCLAFEPADFSPEGG